MNHTSAHAQAHNSAHLAHTTARYTAQEIAEAHSVGESTVRTRWFEWLCKVAPSELLKDKQGYTELARALFEEFAHVDQRDRQQWVADAKARYSQEWESAGVIEGELMPTQVGGALALIQTHNTELQQLVEAELVELQEFVSQVQAAEANFSEAELQMFKATGMKRGIARFKIETQTELEILNALRHQRMGGEQ